MEMMSELAKNAISKEMVKLKSILKKIFEGRGKPSALQHKIWCRTVKSCNKNHPISPSINPPNPPEAITAGRRRATTTILILELSSADATGRKQAGTTTAPTPAQHTTVTARRTAATRQAAMAGAPHPHPHDAATTPTANTAATTSATAAVTATGAARASAKETAIMIDTTTTIKCMKEGGGNV